MITTNGLLVLIAALAAIMTLWGLWLAYKLQTTFNQNSQSPLNRFVVPQVLNLCLSTSGILVILYTWETNTWHQQASTRVIGSVHISGPLRVYAASAEESLDSGSQGFDMRIPDPQRSGYKILVVRENRVVGTATASANGNVPVLLNFPEVLNQEQSSNGNQPKESNAPK